MTRTETEFHLPNGFRFAGIAAGIKESGKPDVAAIVADKPSVGVCVTTTNQVVAAPVLLCRKHAPTASCRGIVINSGNANACTGDEGMEDAASMCRQMADAIGCDWQQLLVMSTGIIGHRLPMPTVLAGIDDACERLSSTKEGFQAAADAICTTDQFSKIASATLEVSRGRYRVAAMCKGAGMIAPNMATMLAVILTDAPLSVDAASGVLGEAVSSTFNRVSVDGHTSTNDTVALLSSSTSDDAECLTGIELDRLTKTITEVSLRLAKMLVADGEGASRFFEVCVNGASDDEDALQIARVVAASPLVKTAIQGGDPNWGRVVSAAGYAGPMMDVARTSLQIDDVVLFRHGEPVSFDADALSASMKASRDVVLRLTVGAGPGKASFWASDLTEDYVRFNSLYTT
ncbi:MAG: bifunctional glutamate N-acetyltransferase/amino-acid acetyltransferase ArgJ [Planctomycetota bacterium]